MLTYLLFQDKVLLKKDSPKDDVMSVSHQIGPEDNGADIHHPQGNRLHHVDVGEQLQLLRNGSIHIGRWELRCIPGGVRSL